MASLPGEANRPNPEPVKETILSDVEGLRGVLSDSARAGARVIDSAEPILGAWGEDDSEQWKVARGRVAQQLLPIALRRPEIYGDFLRNQGYDPAEIIRQQRNQ